MFQSYIMVARILLETTESLGEDAVLAKKVLLERAEQFILGAIAEIKVIIGEK